VRAVTVTLQLIEEIARHGPIGVSELARRTGLPKSTVQRAVLAAADAGWLRSGQPDDTRWTVAVRLLHTLPRGVMPDLRSAAQPHLAALRDATADAVHLVVRDGADVVLLDRLAGGHPVQVVVPLGYRVPLHAGATGKAILAATDPADLDRILPAQLAALTATTIVHRDALMAQLATIRDQGYATNAGEWDQSVAAVAAAITTPTAGDHPDVWGAISVSTTPSRLTPQRVQQVARLVIAAADATAADLAYS
jgi:IclR family transcriptional regulator, acetate operon repressor